ncbi:hypothetical protein [Streptococcus sp. E17BB]|uniref:hypothetical protein n=1 Tax=Streptococcus sp. E17BB TaxID=3278714 RepID=UPI00359D100F
MFYWKLARYKWVYVTIGFFFLALSFKEPVIHYLTFNPNAPDLANFDGLKIKNEILQSMLSVENRLFDFNMKNVEFLVLLIVLMGYDYASLKDKFIRLGIGKNTTYHKMRKFLKIQLGLLASSIYLFMFWLLIIGLMIATGTSLEDRHLHGFLDGSLLDHFFSGKLSYLIFFSLWMALGVFINCLLYFKVLDITKNFLRGAGFYFICLIPGCMLLYYILPSWFVPLTSLLSITYFDWTIPKLLSPFIPYLIGYGVLSYYDRDI